MSDSASHAQEPEPGFEFDRAVPCFPLSAPGCFVSLRDGEGEEVGFVPDPGELPEEERVPLEAALQAASFVFRVSAVLSVEPGYELRVWEVETDRGRRLFQTRLDHWPRALEGGGFLIQDISGDLFLIGDPAGLDERSRRLLFAFTG